MLKRLLSILLLIPSLCFADTEDFAPRIQITELDGSPLGTPYQLKFDNASITDNADGTFTHSIAGFANNVYLKLIGGTLTGGLQITNISGGISTDTNIGLSILANDWTQ